MRALLVTVLVLFGACVLSIDIPDGFVRYVPENADVYISILEEYYDRELDLEVEWYVGTRDNVEEACGTYDGRVTLACIYPYEGVVFMRDDRQEACRTGVHELMHRAMIYVYGDPDGDHVREDWNVISELCMARGLSGQ